MGAWPYLVAPAVLVGMNATVLPCMARVRVSFKASADRSSDAFTSCGRYLQERCK
jgi:hypothetical protein